MAITKWMKGALRGQDGQATIELAITFPVALILAVVVLNLVNYLGVCASFDRVFAQQVRVAAAAPGVGQNLSDSSAVVQAALEQRYGWECSSVGVTVSQDAFGNSTFCGEIAYEPTLFGLNFRSILFGADAPTLRHQTRYAVSCYRPGVLF